MKRLVAIILLVALILPMLVVSGGSSVSARDSARLTGPQSSLPLGFDHGSVGPFDLLDQARQSTTQNQVRIERRVIVRVSPAPLRARAQMLAELRRQSASRGFDEVSHGDCIEVGDIVGIQPSTDNRLLFFTRDRHILAASLEDSCMASAFYAGFYVERSEDGRLCVDRDLLQSRAGASCEVSQFNRVVPGTP